jgi:hypothetical protein
MDNESIKIRAWDVLIEASLKRQDGQSPKRAVIAALRTLDIDRKAPEGKAILGQALHVNTKLLSVRSDS